nr:unnamed protein product [Callosobruchus analis]
MLGCRTGFIPKIKEISHEMIGSHCVIPVHRQALSSKTLPQNLRDSLSISTKIVNYVKNSSLNS